MRKQNGTSMRHLEDDDEFAEHKRHGIFSKWFGEECRTFIVPEAGLQPPGTRGGDNAVHIPMTHDLGESRRLARAVIDRIVAGELTRDEANAEFLAWKVTHPEMCRCEKCGRVPTAEELCGKVRLVPAGTYTAGFWASAEPGSLIGKHVKIPFVAEGAGPSGVNHTEYMWVHVERLSRKPAHLDGRLVNEPIHCRNLRRGERMSVALADIVDVEAAV
jgi:hypothetical protein